MIGDNRLNTEPRAKNPPPEWRASHQAVVWERKWDKASKAFKGLLSMTNSKEIVRAEYNGIEISFSEKGWFNATQAALRFGKRPLDWLRLDDTKKYIAALCEKYEVDETHFIKTQRGKKNGLQGGTWLSPKLAIAFARWLDVHFAVWCDEQIEALLRGNHVHYDWKRMRHEASSSFKVMNEALRLVREEQGKISENHHYSNEARLINWALTGDFKGLDRGTLSSSDLDLLAKLEVKNSVLISRNLIYQDRKKMLEQYAIDLRAESQLPQLCH